MTKQEIYQELLNLSDEIDQYLEGSSLTDELREFAEKFRNIKKK